MSDVQLRAERLLGEASKAVDPHNNGLFDRGDLVDLIARFTLLVQELIEASEQERREMAIRLRRSPQSFGDFPSV